jgi:hypothetical protein
MNCWISDNLDLLQDKYLNEIVLPGTHDSGAYTLKTFFPKMFKHFTLNQKCSVFAQLNNGIRALDLRISKSEPNIESKYMVSHTFPCVELDSIIKQIMKFLLDNESEIVVLYTVIDRFAIADPKEITKYIRKKFADPDPDQDLFIDLNNALSWTLGDLISKNKRLIYVYNGPRLWLNKTDVNEYFENLSRSDQDQIRSSRSYLALDYVLTPNIKYIIQRPNKSLKTMSNEINPHISKISGRWPIIFLDFPNNKNILEIISKNF